MNGNLASTPVVDLARTDIGSSFVLTLKATSSASHAAGSGVLGMITYIAVNGLGTLFEGAGAEDAPATSTNGGPTEVAKATGKAAFFLFLYLEVLDASFSFDGVIGAFAISTDPIIIAMAVDVPDSSGQYPRAAFSNSTISGPRLPDSASAPGVADRSGDAACPARRRTRPR